MKRFNRLGTILASAILTFSSILALSFPSATHAAGTTYKWTGAGVDNLFSTAANWSTMTAPTSGDGTAILEFPMSALVTMDNLSKNYTVTNNISGLNVAQIKFTGSAPTGAYTIDAGSVPIDLTGANPVHSDVSSNTHNIISATLNINNPSAVISTTDNQTTQQVSLNSVNLVGNIATSGRVTLRNISGGHTITAGAGVLSMYNSDSFHGSLVANGLIYYSIDSSPQFASLTVNNKGGVKFYSFGPQTLANSMTLTGPGGSYRGTLWKTIEFTTGAFTLSSPIVLGSNVNIGLNSGATVTVNGFIDGGSDNNKIFYSQGDKSSLTFDTPAIQASFAQGGAGGGSSDGESNDGTGNGGGGSTNGAGGKGGGSSGGIIPINTEAPGAPNTGLVAIMSNPITIAVTTVMCGGAIALIAKKSSVLGLLGR